MEIRFGSNGGATIPKIILTFVLTIGLLGGGILFSSRSSKVKKQCTYKTTAVVSDIKENSDSDGTTYAPVYTYSYNGDEHTVTRKYYSSNMKLNVGDEVEFYLDPNDPETYYCPSEKGKTVVSLALYGFGIVCLLCTVLNIKQYREQH